MRALNIKKRNLVKEQLERQKEQAMISLQGMAEF